MNNCFIQNTAHKVITDYSQWMQRMRAVKNSPQYLANYILLMIGCLSRSEVMTRLIKWNLALASCQSGQAKFIYNLSSSSVLYFKNLAKFSFSHDFYYESHTKQVVHDQTVYHKINAVWEICGSHSKFTVFQCFWKVISGTF